jgi:hypothetical protein
METNGSLAFLGILMTKKPDGWLRPSVHRKPPHTDLYLHAKSCHHPSKKHSVLTTFFNHTKTICEREFD